MRAAGVGFERSARSRHLIVDVADRYLREGEFARGISRRREHGVDGHGRAGDGLIRRSIEHDTGNALIRAPRRECGIVARGERKNTGDCEEYSKGSYAFHKLFLLDRK